MNHDCRDVYLILLQLKEGRILVFLAKENPSQSWMPELEEGLDMFEEEDES